MGVYTEGMINACRILAPLALVLLTPPVMAAEKLSLPEISSYINSLKIVQADFTQINTDGTISTGKIFIRRPGRARFEYNPPSKALVIAGGQQLAIFDEKSNTGPTQYPLNRTPLNLILARKVDLTQAEMVIGHTFDNTATTVVAQDPEHPEYGTIALTFTDSPVELRQWVITDDVGDQTTVILGPLEAVSSLSAGLFNITREAELRQR